jgi:hypothetical protein
MPYSPEGMWQEMLRLAQALLEQTEQNKIQWTTTDKDNQFLFSRPRSSVLIQGVYHDSDPDDEGTFNLVLLNSGGSVAAKLGMNLTDPDYSDADIHQILKNLYFAAQNKALEIDTTLEDMQRALGIETSSEPTSSDT